jgi:hypothetical protein
MIPQVVASERGGAQTAGVTARAGLQDRGIGETEGERNALESAAADGESPVCEAVRPRIGILSSADHEEFCVNRPGPSGKAKYSRETDSGPVP